MPDVKLKWEGDSLQPDGEDDASSQYLLSRQVAHEYHSSAVQSYINAESAAQQAQAEAMQTEQDEFRKKQVQKSAEGKAAEGAFAESMTQSLASRMQPQAAHGAPASTLPTETQPAHMAAGVQSAVKSETAGVDNPTIDPTMAFGAGFGAKLSMEAGKALMPSLGRALAAGVVNAATEYPIGMAADVVGANVPELALPTAVVLGLFSGGTIEPILERGIANAAAKMGQALSSEQIKSMIPQVQRMLASESGQITVYHGSPYKFDKFSNEKIGTGEGAQAFGYGLYFSDLKDIAKGTYAVPKHPYGAHINQTNLDSIQRYMDEGKIEDAKELALTLNRIHSNNGEDKEARAWTEIYHSLTGSNPKLPNWASDPQTYTATLHAGKQPGEYEYLRWDEPVPESILDKIDAKLPKASKEELAEFGDVGWPEGVTGKEFYQGLSAKFGSDKEASEFLLNNGIDGIKYPAGTLSGGNKTGAFNYVVFDDQAITPISRETLSGVVEELNKEIANTPLSRVMQALKGEKGELTIRDPNAPAEPLAPAPVKGGSKKSGIPQPPDMQKAADEFMADTNPDITTKYAGEATGGNIRIWSEDLMPKFVSDITSPEDIDRMLASTQNVFAEQKQIAARGKQSWADTEAGSKHYGIQDILGRRVGQALNDQQIESGRQFLAASSENLKGMADVVKSGTANDLQKMEFMRAFNIHYAVQMQMSGAAAEAGRALQIFRKVAESDTLRVGQLKDFMAGTVSTGIKPEDLAAKLAEMESPAQVAAFVRQAKKAGTYDMLMEAWINGLLSGPVTHSVNVTSNVLTAMWMIPERAMAAGISRVHGGDIRMGEVAAQSYGLVQGFKDGLGLAWQALRKGESSDLMGKIEQSQMRAITAENVQNLPLIKKLAPNALEAGGIAARAVDALGEVIRVPGRFLTAEDELFKSVGYRMELQAQAYRKAAAEGLEGQAMSQRMRDIISNPQELAPEVHLAAVDAARYQTFTSDLGPGGKAIQTAANKIPGLKLVIPFIRTPANIMKFAAERTVLAPLMKSVRADIMAGGARRDMALARMSLGSMAMATVATYAAAGYITGGGPTDTALRQHKYNQGWQPYSIKIGDKYYAYGRLEPLGMMMGLAADAVEIMGELDEIESDKMATTIVAAISKNVMSKTWLRGLSEVVAAMEDPDRHGQKYIKNLAGTVVPTGVAQIERTMSPEISDAQSAMDAIKARVPGYSKDLPTRRNLWGEKITFNGALGPDIVSPIFTSSEKDSPIDKELLRMRAPIRMPQRTQTFEGVPIKLDAYEYEEFMVRMNAMKLDSTGKTLKKSLDELVTKDKDYKSEKNDDMKERMIRAHIQEATEKTRAEMLETNQTLRLLVDDEHRRQAAVR